MLGVGMYAVIDNGGKQYRVEAGETVRLDLLDAQVGELVQFDRVLMIGGDGPARIGTPCLLGARVLAEVISHEKGVKLTLMRMQATKTAQAKKGHRQKWTRVLVREIHPE
jgi:large subunit ribosomal protein L21